jgi:hypothetical protein
MPQAIKLFGYGLLDALGTGGPDSSVVAQIRSICLLSPFLDRPRLC